MQQIIGGEKFNESHSFASELIRVDLDKYNLVCSLLTPNPGFFEIVELGETESDLKTDESYEPIYLPDGEIKIDRDKKFLALIFLMVASSLADTEIENITYENAQSIFEQKLAEFKVPGEFQRQTKGIYASASPESIEFVVSSFTSEGVKNSQLSSAA